LTQLRAATDDQGPDIIYESVGGEVTACCFEGLAPLGQMVIYGALNTRSFQLGAQDLVRLIFKNQSVTGLQRNRARSLSGRNDIDPRQLTGVM
jgi:NADPH2:quinone reductase